MSSTEALFQQFLPLADSIARGFHHKGGRLIELDDCRQVARMELWLACSRIEDPISAPAYLSRSIRGALLHHARDLGRTIRVPRREQEKHGAEIPWVLTSLDAPLPSGDTVLDTVAAPDTSTMDNMEADVQLNIMLCSLPPQEAAAIRLHMLQGLSCRQAAAELGVSAMAISRYTKRGIAAMKAKAACAV